METAIFYIRDYGLYALIILAALKVLLLIFQQGFNVYFMVFAFFKVYKQNELNYDTISKRRFQQVHNLFTMLFYGTLILWGLVFYFFGDI